MHKRTEQQAPNRTIKTLGSDALGHVSGGARTGATRSDSIVYAPTTKLINSKADVDDIDMM